MPEHDSNCGALVNNTSRTTADSANQPLLAEGELVQPPHTAVEADEFHFKEADNEADAEEEEEDLSHYPLPLRLVKHTLKHGLIPHGSMASSGLNLASATLGAGTLALPQAMQGAGCVTGSILLVLVCAGTVYSIRLLVWLVERLGLHTYEELAHHIVGKWFERLTAAMIVAFCWGVTLVYVVAIGDILGSLLDTVSWFPDVFKGTWGHRLLTSIFWALFMLPLSLLKEINSLRYASMIGMASTMFLVLAIVIHASEHGTVDHIDVVQIDLSMVISLPVFAFSYCCQTNAFEIYAELKNRSVNKMTLTAALSMGTCTLIYIVAGVAGVADFGSNVKGDVLKSYHHPATTPYLVAAFVAISFTVTMAFPVCIFPTRDAVLQLVGFSSVYTTPTWVRCLVCALLAVASLIIGLFVDEISLLFGVLGGVCGSSLGFVWPAFFVLRSGLWTREQVGLGNIIATWALLIAGVVIAVFGTAVTLYSQFS